MDLVLGRGRSIVNWRSGSDVGHSWYGGRSYGNRESIVKGQGRPDFLRGAHRFSSARHRNHGHPARWGAAGDEPGWLAGHHFGARLRAKGHFEKSLVA